MELIRYDISPSQWSVLVPVHRGIVITVSALARHLERDKAAISRTVKILEKKGLVKRTKGSRPDNDRRSHEIALTEKCKALIPEIIKNAKISDERFFNGLNFQDVYKFKATIDKLKRNDEFSNKN